MMANKRKRGGVRLSSALASLFSLRVTALPVNELLHSVFTERDNRSPCCGVHEGDLAATSCDAEISWLGVEAVCDFTRWLRPNGYFLPSADQYVRAAAASCWQKALPRLSRPAAAVLLEDADQVLATALSSPAHGSPYVDGSNAIADTAAAPRPGVLPVRVHFDDGVWGSRSQPPFPTNT